MIKMNEKKHYCRVILAFVRQNINVHTESLLPSGDSVVLISEDLSSASQRLSPPPQVETRLYCPAGSDRCSVYVGRRPEKRCQPQLGHALGRRTAAPRPPSDRDGKNIMRVNKLGGLGLDAACPQTRSTNTDPVLFPCSSRSGCFFFHQRPFS